MKDKKSLLDFEYMRAQSDLSSLRKELDEKIRWAARDFANAVSVLDSKEDLKLSGPSSKETYAASFVTSSIFDEIKVLKARVCDGIEKVRLLGSLCDDDD